MSTQVSIILCSHNRAEHLKATLQSLQDVKVPTDWSVELLLVDNASTDNTASVMGAFRHPQMEVRVLHEERKGVSHARNRGVAEARGEVLLFTDDDVRLPERWIERMCDPLLSGEADAVAGGVQLEPEQKDWMTRRHRQLLASTERIDPDRPNQIVGANMAIRRDVFDVIPRFDDELGAGKLGLGEETLFSWQMQEAGLQITAAFDVTVEHHPDLERLSRASFCDMAEKMGRSEAHINYHWRHQNDWSLMALCGGLAYFGIRLSWWRLRHCRQILREEIKSMEEFDLMRRFYRILQHLREQGQEPKYEMRGLTQKHI